MRQEAGPVAYVVKRYPRLSETFILNEILAMERLGHELRIFSLLPPEPPPHHPMVAEVRARVTHLPVPIPAKLMALARAHAGALMANPGGYRRALAHALRLSARARDKRLSAWRQFLRAGFFAHTARRARVAHLHAHFANAPSAVAHFVALMTGLPFSFTAHAKDIYLTPPDLVAQRMRAAKFVVTCTGYNAEHLRGLAPEAGCEKINLVYHGIDLGRFGYRAPPYRFLAEGGAPHILSVGRLVAKKGLDDLIEACALLYAENFEFRCTIVGEGPLRAALAAQISAHGLAGRITLMGAITHARLIDLYAGADLFVLPPRIAEDGDRDGIPNVIVEAMAVGVPVVSTLVSGIPEMVIDGETGLLTPPRAPWALAEAMRTLLADAALGRQMARQARANLERCYDCWQTTRHISTLISGSRLVCAAVAPARAPAFAL